MTSTPNPLAPILALLSDGSATGEWRKAVLTVPKGQAGRPWQKQVAQPVQLSKGPAVKLVTTSSGRETTRTLTGEEWRALLPSALETGPLHLDVLAKDHDWHARRTKSGRWLVTRSKPSLPGTSGSLASHDREREQQLDPDDVRVRQFFIETGLFSKSGSLLGEAAPKYRQVQHYLELLRPMPVWGRDHVKILDAGCGKAYLSLGLLLWAEQRGVAASLVGVDISAEVISNVSGIAERSGLTSARFEASTIGDYVETGDPVDLLVSLHACDTATDEALAAGVRLNAEAIVLVPCCHNELSEQIENARRDGDLPASRDWGASLKFGLARHRLADIVTDSLRAAALESLGYHVDLVEFTTPEITAKNLMIRAVRREQPRNTASAYAGYRALAEAWHVKPALESALGDYWPPSS